VHVTDEQLAAIISEPDERTWQEGWDEVARGFAWTGWASPTAKMVYHELYRTLTHGHDLSPDQALSVLGAAFHWAFHERKA
jgi:hypothetical protein